MEKAYAVDAGSRPRRSARPDRRNRRPAFACPLCGALSLGLGVDVASGPLLRAGFRYFGFERLCKLIAVRLSNPRVTQSREEPSRFFATRGLGAVDAYGRSAPGFLGFGHGTTPAFCAYK